MPALIGLTVADTPELWTELGFSVTDGLVRVGGVSFYLGGASLSTSHEPLRGILDWSLHDPAGILPSDIDGISTNTVLERPRGPLVVHPNGISAIDHLVVSTPHLERTIQCLEDLEIPCRRRRDAGAYGSTTMRQAFFWLGSSIDETDRTILEVVGPAEPDPQKAKDPATFFGIAFVSNDFDRTVAYFGDRAKAPVDAVQPGRRISSLSSKAGSTVAMAFMSPHRPG